MFSKQVFKDSEKMALNLFQVAAKEVPAYKDFLKKNKIKPELIKKYEDLKKVPYVDKSNYITKYPLKDLVFPKSNLLPNVISSSSGSTGEPNYWLTSLEEVKYGKEIHGYIFDNLLSVPGKKTLVVINFAMGTWIAGIYTFLSTFSYMSQVNKASVSVATPGLNKDDTLRLLSKMASFFENIIFIGYPTFVKDILDLWTEKKAYKGSIKFIFAGEPITESWREYILNQVKSNNHLSDAISIYGSADGALMGFETPETIHFRKCLTKSNNLNLKIFNSTRVPSIVSYLPSRINFMEENSELLLTASRTVPLIRYNLHDKGGLLGDDKKILLQNKTTSKFSENSLPKIYIFGRDIFSATIYAAFIYPENVKDFVMDKRVVKILSGKFKLTTEFDKNQNNYLDLKLELGRNTDKNKVLINKLQEVFVDVVTKKNSEYCEIIKEYGKKAFPKITLEIYGSANFANTLNYKKNS